ncbi:MAG: hypothetical protein FWD69_17280 [Polyangiaceae bacterium]|nr:hypothetical protein [Polyangiaceae bacterium]
MSTEAGNDSNKGTKDSPVGSISQALTMAAAQGKPRIYICGTGTLNEQVTMTGGMAVSLYGGFLCSNWEYNSAQKATIKSVVTGAALTVTGASTAVTISDLRLEALPGASPGESSIAVFTSLSTVTFVRTDLVAHDGSGGAAGAAGQSGDARTVDPQNGVNGEGATPGRSTTCTCAGQGTTKGGQGGATYFNGTSGSPLMVANPPGNDGSGGTSGDSGGALACTSGRTGAAGLAGASAGPTLSLGSLTSSGWIPGDGLTGMDGTLGQGGGGGGSGQLFSYVGGGNASGGGGGGGCGGCGGSGGAGGRGAGSSVALLSYASMVTLNACTLSTGQGGMGGLGGMGGAGGGGSVGCFGGNGGQGGAGGGGSGGAGGLSAGILYAGPIPVLDGATTYSGNTYSGNLAGKGGAGGGAAGVPGPDGLTGRMVSATNWSVVP